MFRWIRRHWVIAYFVIAYTVSWSFEVPLALLHQGIISVQLPMWFHYLASLGPFGAALILTLLIDGRSGLRNLIGRIFKWRVDIRYYAFTVLVPVGLFAFACLINRMIIGDWPDLTLLGHVDYLPYLTPLGALGLWLITFGLGEETGWRGYALPHLQKTQSATVATLILGILWASWHLPMFFYRDTYIQMGMIGFPMFAVSMVFAAMIFTWLYNSTNGSVWIVILFHAIFNWLTANEAGGQFAATFLSIAIVVWALYITRRYGRQNAAPSARQVA